MVGYLLRADRVLHTVSFFSSLIDQCSSLANPSNSFRIVHAQLVKLGFSSNTFLSNRCIDLYFKSGCESDALRAFHEGPNKNIVTWNLYLKVCLKCFGVAKARHVFNEMPERDAVSWNTMISGYISSGFVVNGWELFLKMQGSCARWTAYTFSIMLSCVECGNHAKEMHGCIMRNGGCYSHLVVGNSLIDVYGKLGLVDYALSVFLSMEKLDVISWNSIISACSKSGYENFALHKFCLMGSSGFKVDEYTVSALLTAMSNLRDLERGKQMLCLCIKLGFLQNTIVSSAAIDMFSKCNRMESALHVFRELYILDSAICNSMIACYANHNLEENALELFVYSFREDIRPTEFTLSCLIHSAVLFLVEQGSQLHSLVVKTGLELDAIVASSLVEMYGKYGLIGAALNVFSNMAFRDLIAWNTMILALAHNSKVVKAISLFGKLLRSGWRPDHITFSGVLLACRYGRFLQKGTAIFYAMEKQYGVCPMSEHYAYIVDMMIQAGRIDKAIYLLHVMQYEPDALIWESILCACGDCGNLKLIERVAERMMECKPHSTLPYLVLDKIYEQRGRWESLVRVRRKMKMIMIREIGDCSWIGIKGCIFSFEADKMIHYGGKELFSVLGLLMQEIWDENGACLK